jgi:hypothetical protein
MLDTKVFVLSVLTSLLLVSYQHEDSLEQHSVSLQGYTLSLALPIGYERLPSAQDAIIFGRPDSRHARTLELRVVTASQPQQTWQQRRRLANGSVIDYSIGVQTQNIGSGGPEAELVGVVRLGKLKMLVTCHDQAEFTPNARWCLEYLGRLEAVHI